jgi:hypothetical protein
MHSKNERGISMNLRFVLVVLLVLVLDWWFVFDDEDEWLHGPMHSGYRRAAGRRAACHNRPERVAIEQILRA